MIEGADYSTTAHGDWASLAGALAAQGKKFAGRYAVNDKSPGGRGISGAEYRALRDAGIDVFLYWEATAGWMLDGFAAGASGAANAEANLNAAGMPPDMPVYFAADDDFTPQQQAQIDDCLRGAASVIGPERTGIYGGYHVVKRCMENRTATWFCQTSAWSGGMILPGIHLYQYDYNQYVDGTNCDWVRAYQDNYGQASKFIPPIEPVTPKPAPIWWTRGDVGRVTRAGDGHVALAMLVPTYATTRRDVPLYASIGGKKVGSVKAGAPVVIVGTTRDDKGRGWVFVEGPDGYARARASSFQDRFPLP